MYQKLADLKKQAAKIAEQIKKLEGQSPEERLRHAITCRLIEQPDPLIDTVHFIMEAIEEYTAALGVQIADVRVEHNECIAELNRIIDCRNEQISNLRRGIAERDFRIHKLNQKLVQQNDQVTRAATTQAFHNARVTELCRAMDRRDKQIAALKAELVRMVA